MRTINKVILIGNVTRDPEMKQTASGQNICTFTIATNRVWITANGEKKSSSEYHDIVAWAGLAELAQKYVRKSKYVHVEGYLKTRSWDTPEGIKKFKTEIIIDDMILLDKHFEKPEALKTEKIETGNDRQHEKIELSKKTSDEITLPIEI